MPLVTALSMIETACFTRFAASFALSSTAVRAFLTAVRSEAIAARLRARCLIILRFCFSADGILATGDSPKGACGYLAWRAESRPVRRERRRKVRGSDGFGWPAGPHRAGPR